jgi:DNA-binding NtrC family response regulator
MAEESSLQGLRVLVVEDETLVAMLLEDMLADHGCEVAATASRIGQALEYIADDSLAIEAAILDVNLAGEPSFPLAEALAERGVPFVFATGYGSGGLPEAWRDRPTLQKPFSHDEVGRMLARAAGR